MATSFYFIYLLWMICSQSGLQRRMVLIILVKRETSGHGKEMMMRGRKKKTENSNPTSGAAFRRPGPHLWRPFPRILTGPRGRVGGATAKLSQEPRVSECVTTGPLWCWACWPPCPLARSGRSVGRRRCWSLADRSADAGCCLLAASCHEASYVC